MNQKRINKSILRVQDSINDFENLAGGKGLGLKKLVDLNAPVPKFIVLTPNFFREFYSGFQEKFQKSFDEYRKHQNQIEASSIESMGRKILEEQKYNEFLWQELLSVLRSEGLLSNFLAIRSSGIDEDSLSHSFAGQFVTCLFQKSEQQILKSIEECFSSTFSERVMNYRIVNQLPIQDIQMAVVIQRMVNAESAGVLFSHNPIDLSDRYHIVCESVWGQGEGLVSGLYDADHYLIDRQSLSIDKKIIAEKTSMLTFANQGGLAEIEIEKSKQSIPSLTDVHVKYLAEKCRELMDKTKMPLDIEWALENDTVYFLQMRPITVLPNEHIFDHSVGGEIPTLWDNSNIVESFSGVTTPLTFSYAKSGYDIVYKICTELVGVPKNVLDSHEFYFQHMLGFVNGRVYYNLMNWYRVLFLMPGKSASKGFMETMLGVKDQLKDHQKKFFDVEKEAPRYSMLVQVVMMSKLVFEFLRVNKTVKKFIDLHGKVYGELDAMSFHSLSLQEIHQLYMRLEREILREWKAPIINDFLVMIFFGNLKKLTDKWVKQSSDQSDIQNDLLCGEGDLISTRPTKDLMRIAEWFDQNYPIESSQFVKLNDHEIYNYLFESKSHPELTQKILTYIKEFGFRCNNEQKLEEADLNDDPTMVIASLKSYLKNKKYSVHEMELNEIKIRKNAEDVISSRIGGWKKILYQWVLSQARNAVKNRENLRFLRTKSYGTSRKIFKEIGRKFTLLGVIEQEKDIFFLTVDEIFDFIQGVSVTQNLKGLIKLRKTEYEDNQQKVDPPERFITTGVSGAYFQYPQLLSSLDLLKGMFVQTDPNVFQGVSCSPGVVEGELLVAKKIEDAKSLDGHILLTYRTDPGWVPLYPNCRGLAIERGSLLSHSAVVAREMGLPTIVGMNGDPSKKLKSGEKVKLNATKGTLTIIKDGN